MAKRMIRLEQKIATTLEKNKARNDEIDEKFKFQNDFIDSKMSILNLYDKKMENLD